MGRDVGSQKHSSLRLGRLERQGRRGAELHLEITSGHVASSSQLPGPRAAGVGVAGGGFLTELQEHSDHSRAMFTASSSNASPRQKQRLQHCSFTPHSFNQPAPGPGLGWMEPILTCCPPAQQDTHLPGVSAGQQHTKAIGRGQVTTLTIQVRQSRPTDALT